MTVEDDTNLLDVEISLVKKEIAQIADQNVLMNALSQLTLEEYKVLKLVFCQLTP